MSKQKKDYLILLIESLTKAEKRSFRLYVNRDKGANEKLFVQLFDTIIKMKKYDEALILKKNPKIKKSQLSNIKANLYNQILNCLRQLYRHTIVEIGLREQQDFAKVLYSKGLYKASLEMIEKTRRNANLNSKHYLEMSSIHFEKQIESQHVTGSMYPKAEKISKYSDKLLGELTLSNKLSNLSILLYGRYLKNGYARNKKDVEELKLFFDKNLPKFEIGKLGFYQSLYLYQSYVWYFHMIHDFANYYKHALKWVDLFDKHIQFKKTETSTLIKGYHNVLNALFLAEKETKFNTALEAYMRLPEKFSDGLSLNEISQFELFLLTHKINKLFLNAEYLKIPDFILEIEEKIKTDNHKWDTNRLLTFYYKLGCFYFGNGNLKKSISYLNKISNVSYPDFKEDIQCFARILNLIAHFDLNSTDLVSYQVKSVYRFLLKMKDLQAVQFEILNFIKKTPNMFERDLKEEFKKLRAKLVKIKKNPYEQRPFLYLDIIAWLDSKIHVISMVEAIKSKKS